MDPANPLRTVSPTVDADVLAVLSRTHAGLSGAKVARLAGRSYAQATGVLRRLVDQGVVEVEQHGRTYSYRLNRDHVLAPAVEALASAADEVEARVRAAVERWKPRPRAVVLFGSFARRDGDPVSDIDVCLVRPDGVAEDAPTWTAQRYDLARQIERWTGNSAQLVDLSVGELDKAVRRNDPLVAALRREGRALLGPSVRSLLGPPPAGGRR